MGDKTPSIYSSGKGPKPGFYTQSGTRTNVRNKSEDRLLDRNLGFYDKQCSKAVKSIELAQRSLLENLQARRSRRTSREQVWSGQEGRRGSSPVLPSRDRLLNSITDNAGAAGRFAINELNDGGLSTHRSYSLPSNSLSFDKQSTPRSRRRSPLLTPNLTPELRSASLNGLNQYLNSSNVETEDDLLHRASSLPRLTQVDRSTGKTASKEKTLMALSQEASKSKVLSTLVKSKSSGKTSNRDFDHNNNTESANKSKQKGRKMELSVTTHLSKNVSCPELFGPVDTGQETDMSFITSTGYLGFGAHSLSSKPGEKELSVSAKNVSCPELADLCRPDIEAQTVSSVTGSYKSELGSKRASLSCEYELSKEIENLPTIVISEEVYNTV